MEHLPSFSNHIQSLSAEVAILSDSLGSKVENAWRIHHVRPSMARLYLGRTRFEGTQRAAVCHSVVNGLSGLCGVLQRGPCVHLKASVMDYIAMNLPKNSSHMTHVWSLGYEETW